MISSLIPLLEKFIIPLGGYGVFAAEVIEEIIVPIPSAVILLGSGFIFLKGSLTLGLIYTLFATIVIPATIGLTLGSLVIYALGYKGGKPFLDKYEKWLGIGWKDVENVNAKFENKSFDEWSIVLARVIPLIPSVLIAIFCGITRMPVKKYITLTLIGAFFKSLILAIVGWKVGELYMKYAETISKIENLVLVLCVILFIVYVFYKRSKTKTNLV